MGFFEVIAGIFGGGQVSGKYKCVNKLCSGRITPGNENQVRSQLEDMCSSMSGQKKIAFRKYIDSGVWKKTLVKN